MQVGISTWYSGSSGGLDADASSLIGRMTSAPDANRQVLINSLIQSLKAEGIWDKLDVLWLMAAHDSQVARLNWKSSSYTLSPVNSPTFTQDRGYNGNGSTSYLTTGFSPTSSAVATQNDSHIGLWCNTVGSMSGAADIGAQDAGGATFLRVDENGTQLGYRVNQGATVLQGTITGAPGLSVGVRTGASAIMAFKNGVQIGGSSTASTGVPNQPFYICANNSGGVAGNFTSRRAAAASSGKGLSASEILAYYNALNSYLTAVGGSGL